MSGKHPLRPRSGPRTGANGPSLFAKMPILIALAVWALAAVVVGYHLSGPLSPSFCHSPQPAAITASAITRGGEQDPEPAGPALSVFSHLSSSSSSSPVFPVPHRGDLQRG